VFVGAADLDGAAPISTTAPGFHASAVLTAAEAKHLDGKEALFRISLDSDEDEVDGWLCYDCDGDAHRWTPAMPTCRHCGDELPEDSPTHLTSCRAYADWRARLRGDLLTEAEANDLLLLRAYCALQVVYYGRLEKVPELEP
jgi:hypothetical protein